MNTNDLNCTEFCSICENEVSIPKDRVSNCPICNSEIKPCSMCDMDIVNCDVTCRFNKPKEINSEYEEMESEALSDSNKYGCCEKCGKNLDFMPNGAWGVGWVCEICAIKILQRE